MWNKNVNSDFRHSTEVWCVKYAAKQSACSMAKKIVRIGWRNALKKSCSEVAQALQLDSIILIALFFPDTCRSELHLDIFFFLCLHVLVIMATPFSKLHFLLPTCIFYFPRYFNKLLLASCCVTKRSPSWFSHFSSLASLSFLWR